MRKVCLGVVIWSLAGCGSNTVGGDDGPGGRSGGRCRVVIDDSIGACTDQAAANSFDPVLQWSWPGAGTEHYCIVTPLVANLTDDNADGVIDLCDIPDVVVVVSGA